MTQKFMQIPLAKPDISALEKQFVNDVLEETQLSIGPWLTSFETLMAEYLEVKYVIAVNSGTSALHLIIRALGLGEEDEVITTPFSFIASSNSILFEKARPIFVDIDPVTFNINIKDIENKITRKTRAILGVDVFGYPLDWHHLNQLARKYNLYLIDDACEALGATWKGKKIGAWADASAFGFYPNKQITTGEGGLISTNNNNLAFLCKSMRNQGRGRDEQWLNHERLGYNYRLDEMSCALGCAQILRLDSMLTRRTFQVYKYNTKLERIRKVVTPTSPDKGIRSWWVYVILIDNRDKVREELTRRGIQTNIYFPPIHLQPFYKNTFGYKEGDFPVTEDISRKTLALPFYNSMTEEEVSYVVENLKEVL